jgi:hypothetical protein
MGGQVSVRYGNVTDVPFDPTYGLIRPQSVPKYHGMPGLPSALLMSTPLKVF